LDCYVPIKRHPFTKDYFDIKSVNKPHLKAAFETWLETKAKEGDSAPVVSKASGKAKKKKGKSEDDDD
jgi:hypothetical protein